MEKDGGVAGRYMPIIFFTAGRLFMMTSTTL
jgi:hypothetical protein